MIHTRICRSEYCGHDYVVTSQVPLRILMVGPAPSSPHSRGGMATVSAQILEFDKSRTEIRYVSTFDDRRLAVRWLSGAAGMVRAALLAVRGRVDVVHVHLSHGGSVLRKSLPLFVARRRGIPTVIHAHSYNFAEWFESLSPMMAWWVRHSLVADRWLVLGAGIGQGYTRSLGLSADRVSVLYNPAPDVRETFGNESDLDPGDVTVVAVALGRLGQRKGTYDILDAVAQLPNAVRERLAIVLAGDGDVAEVRARADALTRQGARVEVRDWLGPEERDALLATASVFLLPSHDEGLPMALLEAMAAGLAPITSPVGAIPEVINDGENGILVDPGKVGALAEAIERLVDDGAERRKLASGAQSTARSMSRSMWEESLRRTWSELVSRSRR